MPFTAFDSFPVFIATQAATDSANAVGLAAFFTIGLLGGAHCLGMCGPLVTLYSNSMPSKNKSNTDAVTWYELRQHALFNLGRTFSYAFIGALMGLLGAFIFDAAGVVRIGNNVRAFTGLGIGVAIIVAGVGYLFKGNTRIFDSSSGVFQRVYSAITSRVNDWAGGIGIFGLGVTHALLPCPILYPAFLYAFSRGSPLEGALSLGVLGLGTFPTLFIYGVFLESVGAEKRALLHRALGAVFIVLGYIPLSHGLALLGFDVPHLHIPIHQPLG